MIILYMRDSIEVEMKGKKQIEGGPKIQGLGLVWKQFLRLEEKKRGEEQIHELLILFQFNDYFSPSSVKFF